MERERLMHKILIYLLPLSYNSGLHLEPHCSIIVFFFYNSYILQHLMEGAFWAKWFL